jgi:hypothetical protein
MNYLISLMRFLVCRWRMSHINAGSLVPFPCIYHTLMGNSRLLAWGTVRHLRRHVAGTVTLNLMMVGLATPNQHCPTFMTALAEH